MEEIRNRAAAIVIDRNKILLMHRKKNGKEYYVFIGGGIETGETPEAAAIREVMEESCLNIEVKELVYRLLLDQGQTHYFFLGQYISGTPGLDPDSPESKRQTDANFYEPMWFDLKKIDEIIIYPEQIKNWLIEDLKQGSFSKRSGRDVLVINQ